MSHEDCIVTDEAQRRMILCASVGTDVLIEGLVWKVGPWMCVAKLLARPLTNTTTGKVMILR